MRRTLEAVATTLFQRDTSSGRLLFIGCLAVIAITHIDPESAARPPAVVAFFGWMGVHLLLRYLRVRAFLRRRQYDPPRTV
ncbi:hypothetical protein GO308_15190 [Sphingomonas sp. SFZ2018-12]|uniref:hypothetical protein n=1 Tax=Sphingomonas sp. SFZ2018-12 TaxID=2683197 RepID=UPI001F0F5BE4|nr:hypothetical protein [Sphingomonas sp. SFZ2018-12]MCH4894462.1 hypothetical protein [Sphingomonas sp. SFZ2018-12]